MSSLQQYFSVCLTQLRRTVTSEAGPDTRADQSGQRTEGLANAAGKGTLGLQLLHERRGRPLVVAEVKFVVGRVTRVQRMGARLAVVVPRVLVVPLHHLHTANRTARHILTANHSGRLTPSAKLQRSSYTGSQSRRSSQPITQRVICCRTTTAHVTDRQSITMAAITTTITR